MEALLAQKRDFEEQMNWITQVREDVLDTVFLDPAQSAKPVKIRTLFDMDFQTELIQLLTKFQDVFAWDYSGMKGLDPKFY